MKNLPATEEMLAVAREDVPVKVGSGWNTSYRCRYSGFARSSVEGGILKVTLYDPDAMRLGGTLPVYEIFMEKEKQRFLPMTVPMTNGGRQRSTVWNGRRRGPITCGSAP